jgi:hypothetical protein
MLNYIYVFCLTTKLDWPRASIVTTIQPSSQAPDDMSTTKSLLIVRLTRAHHTNLYQELQGHLYRRLIRRDEFVPKQTSMHILLVLTHNILLYTTLSYPVSSVVHAFTYMNCRFNKSAVITTLALQSLFMRLEMAYATPSSFQRAR